MSEGPGCPSDEVLRGFLLGAIETAEVDWLESHLSSCPGCVERMGQLDPGDDLIAALKSRGAVLPGSAYAQAETWLEGLVTLPAATLAGEHAGAHEAPILRELDPPDEPGDLGRLGAYRIQAILGAGGMGVVFRAWHRPTRRTVALKMLGDRGLLDARSSTRFIREGEALAKFRHPRIVQIYEVGEHRGRPFLALEYLGGGSLARRIAGQAQPVTESVRQMADLALAVEHAHRLGILHRDIKPSNILFSDDGTAKVTDFGLARPLDDEGLTEAGDLIGTPGYMAPELTLGRGVRDETGPEQDVYSLGAVLYEMLTGRPPFRGETFLDTLEQARTRDPIRPSHLRPRLPRDVETICLTCLRKEPGRRYRSAGALADDLQRFLDHRPIHARPAGWFERAGKWARRHPSLGLLLAVSTLALAALIIGGVSYERRLARALAEARAGSERAQGNYRDARAALEAMLAHAADGRRGDIPRVHELRTELQRDALAYYLAVAGRTDRSIETQEDAARAGLEAAKLEFALGRDDTARLDLERARGRIAPLAAAEPARAGPRFLLAECDLTLALGLTDPAASRRYFDEALALYQGLLRDEPRSVDYRKGLAAIHRGLATAPYRARDMARAEEVLHKAAAILEEIAAESPGDRMNGVTLAQIQCNLSLCYQQSGPWAEAVGFHDRAERTLTLLLRDDPLDLESLRGLAWLRINWAEGLIVKGKLDEALLEIEKTVGPLEEAHRKEPNLVSIRRTLASTYGVRAKIRDNQHRPAAAIPDWERLIALDEPERRAWHRATLVNLLNDAGDHARAAAEAERLLAELPPDTAAPLFIQIARCTAAGLGRLPAADPRAERLAEVTLRLLEAAPARAGPAERAEAAKDLRDNDLWAPLRGRPRFKQLLND
jgi:tetratricopeptide (TPR) repeat protein